MKTVGLAPCVLLVACEGLSPAASAPTEALPPAVQASAAARPSWLSSSEVAPEIVLDDLLTMGTVVQEGPLQEGFLRCMVETDHRGDKRRTWAASRGIDTSLPDIHAELSVGRHHQRVQNPENSREALAALSVVTLAVGGEVSLQLWDRGVLRQHHFDTLQGVYGGTQPTVLEGESSRATCGVVPAAVVQEVLERRLESVVDRELVRLEQRSVDLGAEDLGKGLSPDPRRSLDAAAALVGWHHPALVSRVARVQAAEDDFRGRAVEAVGAAVAHAPTAVVVGETEVRPVRMRCPRPLGFVRRGSRAACVLEVEVSRGEGDESRLDLDVVTVEGEVVSSLGSYLPKNAAWWEEVRWGELEAGTEGVLLYGYSPAWGEPAGLRVWSEARPVWVSLAEVARW